MTLAGQHIEATGGILARLGELKDYPNQELAPYEEFWADGRTYYFTPGGSLYRKDPEKEGADTIFGVRFSEESGYGGRSNTDE